MISNKSSVRAAIIPHVTKGEPQQHCLHLPATRRQASTTAKIAAVMLDLLQQMLQRSNDCIILPSLLLYLGCWLRWSQKF
mmetsp:Transcript_58950/g.140737  ORF Transcript_58950/g.140737 Transcript_58950/m.140737 type:complete len:80 (-) Transcript_58950:2-241(-)